MLYISKEATDKLIISMVYGSSVIFLFLASSSYHYFKKEDDEVSIWRKLDHIAIFIMIAGTYTPICFLYLTGYWRWSIIIIQWILVFGGLFFKFFYLKAPRYLYTLIYLLMGWMIIVSIRQLLASMPGSSVLLLLLGGLAYTTGAIFYIVKKPKLRSGFGFHEIFHFFILLGAFFHYILVYNGLT